MSWKLIFEDNFDKPTIDLAKWSYDTGNHGFGNNELQYYTTREENIYIENSNLVIKALKEDYLGSPYTSGKLWTKGHFSFTYGYVEVKARLPKGKGIWPALWMMPENIEVHGKWSSCGEIDIMELVGHEPNTIYGTIHYGLPHTYHGGKYCLEQGSFADDYHVFGLEWDKEGIRWYVDGKLYHEENYWFTKKQDGSLVENFPAPFNKDFYLIINLAVGGRWPGYPDETTSFPQEFIIDYVRVYQKR